MSDLVFPFPTPVRAAKVPCNKLGVAATGAGGFFAVTVGFCAPAASADGFGAGSPGLGFDGPAAGSTPGFLVTFGSALGGLGGDGFDGSAGVGVKTAGDTRSTALSGDMDLDDLAVVCSLSSLFFGTTRFAEGLVAS